MSVLGGKNFRLTSAVLRKMKVDKPAKTGDAIKYAVIHECTLRVDNEAAHACVADLTDA